MHFLTSLSNTMVTKLIFVQLKGSNSKMIEFFFDAMPIVGKVVMNQAPHIKILTVRSLHSDQNPPSAI